ncbi:MAG TPA: Uma2 family endonuclease [Blastocatellia bacterium]|nr:Uma2 family endonuclease [Blastocatellia bacterium]
MATASTSTVTEKALYDAVTHLPPGGRLTLYDVDWEEYEQLFADLGDNCHYRVSYDEGRLEVMSPSSKHEKLKNLVHDMLVILSDELDREVLSYGSTTLKLKARNKGAEGDDCFYIQHAGEIEDRDEIDLRIDPPPDLVVEIDLTHSSSKKLAIYAALGVPEVWRYDGRRWHVLELAGDTYGPVDRRLAFPILTGDRIADFVSDCEKRGRKQALRAFRSWVKTQDAG